jgi:predicted nucleic acid-binding protein
MAGMAKAGRPMKAGDAWIAATARLIGAPLVTNNRKDFEPVPGLTVISFAPVHADSQ